MSSTTILVCEQLTQEFTHTLVRELRKRGGGDFQSVVHWRADNIIGLANFINMRFKQKQNPRFASLKHLIFLDLIRSHRQATLYLKKCVRDPNTTLVLHNAAVGGVPHELKVEMFDGGRWHPHSNTFSPINSENQIPRPLIHQHHHHYQQHQHHHQHHVHHHSTTERHLMTLGLKSPCTWLEIKQKYKEIILNTHPDKSGTADTSDAFSAAKHAYNQLSLTMKK
jgi:hypothetical protein